MSNEWAHDAARKGVPTEMNDLIHVGHVLAEPDGRAQAGSAGAYLRRAGTAQLVQDKGIFVSARPKTGTKVVVARPQTTLQKNPFMTRSAVVSGASSGPHRAWDPV
jgi:hypothetical protein